MINYDERKKISQEYCYAQASSDTESQWQKVDNKERKRVDIKQAVDRLNTQLPLKARQDELDSELKALHQAVLYSLINSGRPPALDEVSRLVGEKNIDGALQRLATDDLVVLDAAGKHIVGAYPVTIEKTPHCIAVNGKNIFAMCALDAVSVAPLFDTKVEIESHCYVTQEPIAIVMQGEEVRKVQPSPGIRVGVRWQMPSGAAAHSMCLQMVFLINKHVAREWQHGDTANKSVFDLPQAVEFGRQFFAPLLR